MGGERGVESNYASHAYARLLLNSPPCKKCTWAPQKKNAYNVLLNAFIAWFNTFSSTWLLLIRMKGKEENCFPHQFLEVFQTLLVFMSVYCKGKYIKL
jgi:hypothetical protein